MRKKPRSKSSIRLPRLILLGLTLPLLTLKDAPQSFRALASMGPIQIASTEPRSGETDPVLIRLQSEALAVIETYAETGGPRSFKNEVPQGPERYEARANYMLREMGKKLHTLDPIRFRTQGLSILNVATLLETIPGHGAALSELIRTPRSDHRRSARLEVWKRARAGLPFQLESEIQRPEKKPRNLYVAQDSTIESIKESALQIMDQFADQGGPWPKDMKKDPERYQAATRALSNLRRMNLRLSELDPRRFTPDRTLENLARLFDGESEEGTALAILFRHNRAIYKAEIPRVTQNWLRHYKRRKAIDCLMEAHPK